MSKLDLKFAVRALVRSPMFTTLAILCLALAIGANAGIFAVVDAVLLKPLPFDEPDRLAQLWVENEEWDWYQMHVSSADFLDWQERSEAFESMAAYTDYPISFTLTDTDEPERLLGGIVTANFFDVLGVRAVEGRTFRPEENWAGNDAVAVLSHGLWHRRFGGDPEIVDRQIVLNGQSIQVVGVLPPGFRYLGGDAEIWSTFGWDPVGTRSSVSARQAHNRRAVGRLASGVSLRQAGADLDRIAAQLEKEYPEINRGMKVGLTPLREWVVGDTRTPLFILSGAVGLVLLIACVNLANLMLARGRYRKREVAVRTALGAARVQIARQLLVESVLLSLAGGAVGLVFARWAVGSLRVLGVHAISGAFEVSVDWRVFLFTAGVAVLTGMVFGMLPAIQISRPNLSEVLSEASARTAGLHKELARSMLVVAEVGLAVVLVVGAGLLLRSFVELQRVETGFDAERLLTAKISLPRSAYGEDQAIAGFYQRLVERIGRVPQVESAAATSILRLSGEHWTSDLSVRGKDLGPNPVEVWHSAVSPGYFETMGLPLLEGEAFTAGDDAASAQVVVVNETLARQFFPEEEPVGRELAFEGEPTEESTWWRIVGVVEDESQDTIAGGIRPEVYRSALQWPQRTMTVVVRTADEPLSQAKPLRDIVLALDPDLPLYDVSSMEQVVADSLSRERFLTWLLGLFALVALVQAAIGIYGIVAFSVSQRTREIGVRMALGAESGEVLRLVIRQGMVLVVSGLILGVAGAFGLTRSLSSQLYNIGALDPVTYLVVLALLLTVGLVACSVPALRAVRVDPVSALRNE